MARHQKAKSLYGVKDTKYSASDLVTIHTSHIKYFDELWTRGRENELYRTGSNLSDKQKDDYTRQDRIPFPNAITCDKLNRIIESQQKSRTSVKAEATKPDSEVKAELLNVRFKQIEKDSNFAHIGSRIFESGVAFMYGVGEIVAEYDRNGNRVIKIKDVNYKNCIWDSNAVSADALFLVDEADILTFSLPTGYDLKRRR